MVLFAKVVLSTLALLPFFCFYRKTFRTTLVINSFMKEMVEDWNQDFQILLIEHADESFWTGDNKLEYFTTKANFDGDNALVPFHVIKKKKYENNNR